MTARSEEPTPPAPLPEGKGEKELGASPTSAAREGSVSPPPFREGGPGGVGRRRKFALGAIAIALVALGVWYFAIYDREPADDLGRFQGEWQLAVPAVDRDNKPAARMRPVTIRIEGDRWAYVADGKEQRRYALTLRPEAQPKEIDLVMLGPDGKPTAFVLRGVYEVGGGRAKVVTAPASEPRPTSLDDPDAGTVWLLERVK